MDLSIVIVNYNSGQDLDRCLHSIVASPFPGDMEVLVVDNASHDGSEAVVAAKYPQVHLRRNRRNVGFGAGVNVGTANTTGRYVLVLNPDIVVQGETLKCLVQYMDENAEVGLCAPKLVYPDGSVQLSCRTFYTVAVLLLRRTWMGAWFPDHPAVRAHLLADWDHAETREVDWVLGAAMLFRRGVFSGPSIMDERFFLYFEDVDVCRRLSLAGWRVVYHPACVMTHAHRRASAQGWMGRARFEHLRSWLRYEWKHRVAPCFGWSAVAGLVPRASGEPHA